MGEYVNSGAVAELCRLRFHAAGKVFDLVVPQDVPLADLLPAVLGYAGPGVEEQGVDHNGWILQRLGGEPLDEERTPLALDLRDGDTLYLRPRADALPPVHFDDLVDGIATGMKERGGAWSPRLTHGLALALALTALAAGLALLLLPGARQPRDLAAAGVGVLLLLGAASAARAVGDAGAGAALGAAAVPYLALAGALLPPGRASGAVPAELLAAGSAAAGAAVLGLAAAACSAPMFLGVLLAALLTAAAGAAGVGGLAPTGAAALVAVLAVVLGAFVPALCFRLSGLRLPALPRNAEELQEGIEPFPARDVLDRTEVADGYLTAFHIVLGSVLGACLVVLSGAVGGSSGGGSGGGTVEGRGWVLPVLTAVLSLLLLLHSRALGGVAQRLSMLLPGVLGLLLVGGVWAVPARSGERLLLLAALSAAAAALSVAAWTLPSRRLLPYWGRIADLLHTLSAIALLPLALDAVGLYHALRSISG